MVNFLYWPNSAFVMVVLNTLPFSPRGRPRLKCEGTRAETKFRLSAKRTSPFKSVGASVQSTTGSRGVRNSGSNAGYTTFRGSVKSTGYPLHSPVTPSLPLPCVTVCHHISTGLYCSDNLDKYECLTLDCQGALWRYLEIMQCFVGSKIVRNAKFIISITFHALCARVF